MLPRHIIASLCTLVGKVSKLLSLMAITMLINVQYSVTMPLVTSGVFSLDWYVGLQTIVLELVMFFITSMMHFMLHSTIIYPFINLIIIGCPPLKPNSSDYWMTLVFLMMMRSNNMDKSLRSLGSRLTFKK